MRRRRIRRRDLAARLLFDLPFIAVNGYFKMISDSKVVDFIATLPLEFGSEPAHPSVAFTPAP
jgi:hypothetical protein